MYSGTDPSKWPEGLDDFVREVTALRELSLYEERRSILDKFFESALKRISIEENLKVSLFLFIFIYSLKMHKKTHKIRHTYFS